MKLLACVSGSTIGEAGMDKGHLPAVVKPKMIKHAVHISVVKGPLLIGACLICRLLSSFSIQYRMFNFSFIFSCPVFMLYCFYLRTSVAFFITTTYRRRRLRSACLCLVAKVYRL